MEKFLLVLVFTLFTVPASLQAAESAYDKESVATMEEVVVTATKTEEKRRDIANSVVLLDSIDIAESPAQSVGELLANEPGIDWRTRGNYGGASEEIHIRGMGADGTQVVVNGVVINSPSLGSADLSQLPLNSIARVEVVKGPGSLLYGSGAVGGTVNIITKRPKREGMSAVGEVGFGSEATYQISAEQGMFFDGDVGYYLTVNRKGTDGFRDNSDLEHTDASLNIVLDKGDKLDVSLYNDFVDREYGVPGPKPPVGTADYFIGSTKFYNSESASLVNRGGDENHRSVLEVKSKVSERLALRMKADYSVQESYNYNRRSSSGTGSETLVDNTIKGVEGNVNASPLSWLSLIVGSEYRDFDYENEQQSLNASGVAIAGAVSQAEHGVFTNGTFAEINLKPVDSIKLIAGYRHEKHSLFGHEDVGHYGMVVNPLENTAIKINHGKHFKAPTMNDLFWPDSGYAKGNLSLKPETGWHSDFTVEQSLLENRVFATISYFKWNVDDKIDWAQDPTQPALWGFYWTPSNINSYKATGWELNAKVGPYYGVVADLGLTLQDVEEEMSLGIVRQALYKPEKQFKLGLTHLADFGLTSVITARYVGQRPGYYQLDTDLDPQEVLESYWTVDLKLEQVLAEQWHLSLIASNLFDEGYGTYLASFDDQATAAYDPTQQPYPGAGRAVFVSAAYSF